jgi:cellulose biosynthesis protein BcsQ
MDKIHFDSSLNICIEAVLEFIKPEILAKSVIIRDITGQLGVVLACKLSETKKAKLCSELINKLGPYARPYALVCGQNDFDSKELLQEADSNLSSMMNGVVFRFLDRRAVGVDWMSGPAEHRVGNLPCFVFASIKGGVGRSTALCVAAAHLSRRGRRVLAIDFDLEAPGIGSMLLHEKELPKFGSLDFLVESQVGGFDEELIHQLIGSSFLGSAGARVDVVPAIGKTTLENPQNALAKIARAYLEMPSENEGPRITLSGKLKKLVELCEATGCYDVVLIDSRAGLHESTAAAMLALGGELLLFGTNQPQTFQGYSLLFAHLAQFRYDPQNDWRERLTFVHAKAGRTDKAKIEAARNFRDIYRIVADPLGTKEQQMEKTLGKDDIEILWDESLDNDLFEESIECDVLHIVDDGLYHDFDPITRCDLLETSIYENSFFDLIKYLDNEIASVGEE